MKIAIYPGSFDPITKGHLDILKGYEASLEAARKEQEWLNNQK